MHISNQSSTNDSAIACTLQHDSSTGIKCVIESKHSNVSGYTFCIKCPVERVWKFTWDNVHIPPTAPSHEPGKIFSEPPKCNMCATILFGSIESAADKWTKLRTCERPNEKKNIQRWKLASLLDAIKTVRALLLSSLDSNFEWTQERWRTGCLDNVSLWLGCVVLRASRYVCANEIANHLRWHTTDKRCTCIVHNGSRHWYLKFFCCCWCYLIVFPVREVRDINFSTPIYFPTMQRTPTT